MAKKLPKNADKGHETYPSKEETKVEIVNLILSGQETVSSMSRLLGRDNVTIGKWVQELAPGFHTLTKIEELDTEIIEDRADRLAAAARIVVITRILELVKDEKNTGKLASVLKELKRSPEANPLQGTTNNFFTQYVQEQLNIYKKK